MLKLVVVNGATLRCSEGSRSAPLTVFWYTDVKASSGKLVATILDSLPDANIPSFDSCKKRGDCKVNTGGKHWDRCIPALEHASEPLIPEDATLSCNEGGTIRIEDAGQPKWFGRSESTNAFMRQFLLDALTPLGKPNVLSWINNSSDLQLFILFYIFRYAAARDPAAAREILGGGQMRINDGGRLHSLLYEWKWRRKSSHDTMDREIGIDMAGEIGHALIGRDPDGGTRIQLEAHGVGPAYNGELEVVRDGFIRVGATGVAAVLGVAHGMDPGDALDMVENQANAELLEFTGELVEGYLHGVVDYGKYKETEKNVGPFGLSDRNDGDPIDLP